MPVSRTHSVDNEEDRPVPDLADYEPLTDQQEKAKAAILDVFAELMDDNAEERERYEADPRGYLRAVASVHGVTDEDFIDACGKEAIMIILGTGWGVGPKATLRSRLWWRIHLLKEKFKRD